MRGAERGGLRYARVPTGRETCGWCMMLASRGFAFTSASAASAGSHEGCDCVVVPGTPETRVEGYDHEGMARRWGECVSCVDGAWLTRLARSEWEAMTGAERAKWAGKADRKTRDVIESLGVERAKELGLGGAANEETAFRRYQAHRLAREAMKEAERRDPAWAYQGEVAPTDYSANPMQSYGTLLKPGDYSPDNIVRRGTEWCDLWAHHVLEQNGIRAQTRPSTDVDLLIDGQWWEVKSPKPPKEGERQPRPGNELRFIEASLRAAVGQFRARGLDNVRVIFNPRYRHMAGDKEMLAEMELRMHMHGVHEVIFICDDGSIRRLK